MIRKIALYVAVFVAMIMLFSSLMILVYCIPTSAVINNVNDSLSIIEKEGEYRILFANVKMDNFTDRIMINRNAFTGDNPLLEAFNNLDYNRYWHGYMIFLRPMLLICSIKLIRVISTIIFFVLFITLAYLLYKKLNLRTLLAFVFAIISVGFFVIPLSLQFQTVFIITFVFSIILLCMKDHSTNDKIPLTFLIVGMITNFLDFLTVPIITLGIPLTIHMLMIIKSGGVDKKANVKKAIFVIVLWFLGYGLCWVSKWMLASLVLRENIFDIAIKAVFFRTAGDAEYSGNPIFAVGVNIGLLFYQVIPYSIIMLLVLVSLVVIRIKFKNVKLGLGKLSLIFWLIGIIPYCWYFVLANHSFLHSWFTFRAQAVTIFSVSVVLLWNTDVEKFKGYIKKKLRRKKC